MDKFMEHTKSHDDNQTEQQRLEGQHEVILYAMGKAVYAPVDFSKPGLRILDSGCANGRWLKDLQASSSAKHEYVGTDIVDSIFPKDPPEGMSFQLQSIKDPWPPSFQGSFDLVHQRLVMPGAAPGSPKPALDRLAGLLKAGSWLQQIEMDPSPNSENPPQLELLMKVMRTMFEGVGLGPFSQEMKDWMEQAGLKHVQEKVVYVPHGDVIGDKSLKQKSISSPCSAVAPLTKVLKTLPHPFSDDELDNLEPRLRKELEEKGGHTRFRVVWGQK